MPKQKINMVGIKYGRLTAIREATPEEMPPDAQAAYYLFQCDCGNTHIAKGISVRTGKTKSCGCLKRENMEKARKKKETAEKPKKQEPPKETNQSPVMKKLKKYEAVRAALCQEYDRKCLTRKCPLAKFGCYEFSTMAVFKNGVGANGWAPVEKVIKQAAKERGIEL